MGLFNLGKPTLFAVIALVVLIFIGLLIPQCHAAESPLDAPYVQMSAGYAVVRGETPALDLTFTEPANVLRNAYFQGSLTVIGSSNFEGKAVPNNFAARALFVDGFGKFDVGLGLSWMQNYLPYNGGPINFALQLAYRFPKGMTLTYAHMSDAGSKLPNLGRDIVLLGWRFH